jgi:hypothetical protein
VRRSCDKHITLTVKHGCDIEDMPESAAKVLGRVVARWTLI